MLMWYFYTALCYITWIFKGVIPDIEVLHIAKVYNGGLRHFVEMLDGYPLVKFGRWYAVVHNSIPISISSSYIEALEYIKPSILHIHNVSRNEAYSSGIPYVVTLHDYHFMCPRDFGYCLWDKCKDTRCTHDYRDYLMNFLSKADKIIAPDESIRNFYLERYPTLTIEVIAHE